jgi:predicted transcriptional regulator
MPSQHKHPPVTFRPPPDLREWLYAHAEATGRSVGSILTQALEEARRAEEGHVAAVGPRL